MLNHEEQTPAVPIPAAERRVSAEELTRAVSALEDAKAAERVAGVAPIGQVVDELGLDSTPEEIWTEVQKQRAQKAAEAAPKPQAVPVVQTQQIGRQVRRGWRGMRGWVWVIFWCTGGFGLLSGLPHLLHHQPPGFVVNGDGVKESYQVTGVGTQRDVTVSGDSDNITVYGDVRVLTVDGDENSVTVIGSVQGVSVNGDNSKVHWTKGSDNGVPLQPNVSGDENNVGQSAP